MDDWVIITPGRWNLRRIVKIVNTILNLFKIEKHLDKTFIGRAVTEFDFPCYRVKPGELPVAQNTIKRHFKHIDRLYEQVRIKTTSGNMFDGGLTG